MVLSQSASGALVTWKKRYESGAQRRRAANRRRRLLDE
jgi:hypothetical protein